MSRAIEVGPRGDCEVVLRCVLPAPRELVFEALARPILAKRWMGRPAGWTLVVCENDLRPGGAWRFVWYTPAGTKVGLRGMHRAVRVPERLVTTVLPDSLAEGDAAIVTVTLGERVAGTVLEVNLSYDSRAARDRAVASLERSAAACLDELAALLALASDPDEAREDA